MARFSLLAVLILTGCAAPTPAYIHVCPVNVTYSAAFEQRAANEMPLLPPDSAIVTMLGDYFKQRRETVACQGKQP